MVTMPGGSPTSSVPSMSKLTSVRRRESSIGLDTAPELPALPPEVKGATGRAHGARGQRLRDRPRSRHQAQRLHVDRAAWTDGASWPVEVTPPGSLSNWPDPA